MRLQSLGINAVGRQVHASSPAARSLRAEPKTSSIRLIALTAYGSPEDRQRAFRSSFESHLTQPASVEQLKLALAAK
jgi:CheY-like chemotaxis protein